MIKFRNIVMMFALILAVSLCGCDGSTPSRVNTVQAVPTGTSPTTPIVTGLTIQSTLPVDAETRNAMTQALTTLFAEAKARGYKNYVSHSDYTVIVRNDCRPAPESGVMSWQEETPGYGLIWQAERVTISSSKVQSFQICRDNLATMANTTRYGAEHIVLYFNDKAEFERTKIHSTPELGHPIIR
jgi:hypothetical protein